MKKTFTILIAAIVAILMMALPEKAIGETYSITSFTGTGTYSTNGGSQTISSVTWTYSSSTYIGIQAGMLQIGKKNSAQTSEWTFQTAVSSFGTNKKITSVYASLYCGETTASYSISAGGSNIASGSLSTTASSYGANNLNVTSGDIIITLQAGSGNKKAMYITSITITYEDAAPATPSIAFTGTTTHNALYTGTANQTFTGTYSNLGNNPTFNVAFYATAAADTDPLTGDDIPTWLTVSAYNNNGALGGQITVDPNNGSERHAYFKVYSGTTYSSNVYTVNQEAAPYTVTLNKYAVNVDYTQHINLQDIDVTTNLTVTDASDFLVYFYENASDDDNQYLNSNPTWIPTATVVYNSTAEKYQVKYTINSCPSNVSSSRIAYFRVYAADDNNEAFSETVTVTQTPMPQAAAPQFMPGAGAVTIGTTVTLSCETANSTIYYTINGGDITEYEGAITINTATTIQAFATADNYRDSELSSAVYTIAKVAAPTFTPNGGVFTSTQEVTINKADGATVYYTLDGTAPSTSSTLYEGAFTLSATTTVKAIAVKANYANSDVAEATFTKAEVHTVAWAIANTPSSGTSENYYIQGVVSSLYSTSIIADDYHRYYIKDENANNELLVFNGKGLNNVSFSNANDLLVGDEVLIYGGLTTYNSTKEIAKDNYIVTLVRRPSIDAENVNLAANATSGEITYTLINPVEGGELSISKIGNWFNANLVIAENKVTLSTTANTGVERTGSVTITYTYNTNETVSKEVTVKQDSPSTWELTNFADLTPADVFVIVCNKTIDNNLKHFAMSNDKSTSNPPDAVEVSVGESSLSNAPESKLQWNMVITDEGYVFYPAGETDKWLYYRNNNNALRVGGSKADNSSNKHFVMDDTFNYLKTVDLISARYFGVYNSQDWRGYNLSNNAIANNIKDQTFSFYRKVTGPVSPTLGIDGCGDNAGGYYLIASPVASVTPSTENGFLREDGYYDLYYFDQSEANEWMNYKQEPFNLVPGKGYLYANKDNTTLNFEGQPYNGNGVVALTYDVVAPNFAGWNLIGNPFATTAYLDDDRDFYRMNAAGTGIFVATDDAIALTEGIFVQAADADDESVTFTTTAPGGSKSVDSRIVLNLVGNNDNVIDRAIVRFNDRKSLSKLLLHEDNTNIYIPQGDKKFAIVQSNGKADMPVNFKAAEMGKYTISVNTEGIDMDYLHLIDRLTGEDVNLLLDNSYSFVATAQDVESRFILSFTATGYNADADEPFAYQNGSEIIVNGEGELQIFDVTGRQVMTTTINGIVSVNVSAKGVLILRLVGTEVKTQKMVVR